MSNRSLLDELKYQVTNGKMTVRLIFLNLGVFIVIGFFYLLQSAEAIEFNLEPIVRFPTDGMSLLRNPWTLIFSIFGHFSLNHLFFNMLFLFFSGLMFEQLFGGSKLLILYIVGGITGNLCELLSSVLLPGIFPPHFVIGASGSIMAVFSAVAFYRPKTSVNLFGIFPLPIYVLALFFLAKDLIGIGAHDEIAHFAHLGGAFIGFLAQHNPSSRTNLLNLLGSIIQPSRQHPKKTAVRYQTDDEYNAAKSNKQAKIDQILDKISKSGYESLSREEKDFLFNQGNQ